MKDDKEIKITIKLRLPDLVVELTIEEAEALRSELDRVLPRRKIDLERWAAPEKSRQLLERALERPYPVMPHEPNAPGQFPIVTCQEATSGRPQLPPNISGGKWLTGGAE